MILPDHSKFSTAFMNSVRINLYWCTATLNPPYPHPWAEIAIVVDSLSVLFGMARSSRLQLTLQVLGGTAPSNRRDIHSTAALALSRPAKAWPTPGMESNWTGVPAWQSFAL